MRLDLDTAQIASTFTELAAEAESIARGEQPFHEFVQGLTFVTSATGSRGDVREMADLRGKLARLVDRLKRLEALPDTRLLEFLTGFIEGLMGTLEQIEVTTRIALQARRRDAEVRRLRDRVLDELERRGRARPRDLVSALQCAPAQVSRALRELDADRLITAAEPPRFGDRRARWYRAISVREPAAERAERLERKAAPTSSFIPRGLEHEVLARIKCAQQLRFDETRQLTRSSKDDLQRTLALLAAGDLIQEVSGAYTLTQRGEVELRSLSERGFAETVEDVELLVPDDLVGVVALVGAPGSGKRDIGRELARRRGWIQASIGSFIRSCAPGEMSELELRRFADELIAELGWAEFMRRLIASKGIEPGRETIVIDGSSPYPEGLEALRSLYSEHDVVPVFLDAPDWLRQLRHVQEQERGFDPESAPFDVESSRFARPPDFDPVPVQG